MGTLADAHVQARRRARATVGELAARSAEALGTRMRSDRAKVRHQLGGRPLVRYPLDALAPLAPARVALVVGHQADTVRAAAADAELADIRMVLQAEQRGTGHAVACAAT